MPRIYNAARNFWRDDRGQDLIEYALLVAFVAVTAAVFFPPSVMPGVAGIFSKVVSCFQAS
jgi:Flp pilus assembly pilin Flp